MRTYSYRGYTDAGKSCKGLIEAFHEKEAGEKLAERNIYATRLEEAGHDAKRSFFSGGRRRTVSSDARALLYRELAVLLRAGLTLTQALELLIDTPELLASHTLLAGIRDAIRQGSSLAAAQEQAGLADQPLERALIEMGERAGALGDVLLLLADYLDERGRLRDRIQTALIYPTLVLMMSVVIMIFMFGFMMPRFAKLFDEARLVLPLFTRVVLAGGRFAGIFLSALLLLAGLGFILWRGWFSRRKEVVIRLERFLFSLPGVGFCYAAVVNVRFSRTLALLLRGGVGLIEGLTYAGRATNSQWVENLITTETENVRRGSTLAAAIRRVPPLAGSLPGWIQAGEAGGDISIMLEEAARRYQQQWDRMIARFLAVLEPVLILLIGFGVLIIALAVLMPVMSLNNALGS